MDARDPQSLKVMGVLSFDLRNIHHPTVLTRPHAWLTQVFVSGTPMDVCDRKSLSDGSFVVGHAKYSSFRRPYSSTCVTNTSLCFWNTYGCM